VLTARRGGSAAIATRIPGLPPGRIGRALQLGCPASALSSELAARCGALLVVADDERAVREGRRRHRATPHVRFDSCHGPRQIPTGPFELIVCSGLFRRWDRRSVVQALRHAEAALEPGGSLLAIHERNVDPAAVLDGDELHALLGAHTRLRHAHGEAHPGYMVDRWQLGY
jgi:hypothetical protein